MALRIRCGPRDGCFRLAGAVARPRRFELDIRAVTNWKPSRPVLAVLIVLHVIVTIVTLRDIGHRTEDQVRGPRWFWRIVAPLQMGNSVVYWIVGRKKSAKQTEASSK